MKKVIQKLKMKIVIKQKLRQKLRQKYDIKFKKKCVNDKIEKISAAGLKKPKKYFITSIMKFKNEQQVGYEHILR